jgi:hypothetical protein
MSPTSNRANAPATSVRPAAMNPEVSNRAVEDLNRQRLQANPNARPLPHGEITQHGQNYSIKTPSGREYEARRDGSLASFRGAHGEEAHFGPHNEVRSVHLASGATVIHGPGGSRIVHAERADHSVIVANRAGHGYLERPFVAHGQFYRQRVYVMNGHPYVHAYRQYYFHGARAYYYVPAHYYSPAFYGWAARPWASPVRYRWGWTSEPWYGYYGGYFVPSPIYPTPSLWLTDYALSASLEEAYQEQVDAQGQLAPGGVSVPLSPEVKSAIASEIGNQLSAEEAEGQQVAQNRPEDPTTGGLPALLADGTSHVFLVSSALTADTPDGQSCALTGGDVLQLSGAPAPDSPTATLQVLAAKASDCQPGQMAAVQIADLQEMQNHLRETLDAGLDAIRASQGGVGKLPPPPRTALPGTVNSPYADSAPPVDANASSEINGEVQTDVQADQDVTQQAENPNL